MSNRAEWEEFLLDPTKPARFFASASSGIGVSVHPVNDEAVLDLLSRLSSKQSEARDLVDAIDFFFGGYREFLLGGLKQLLRSLSYESFDTTEIQGPSIKGRVDWHKTISGRNSGRLAPFQYVARRTNRSNDTPENRVVLLFLKTVAADLNRLSASLGTQAIPSSILEIKHAAERGLKDFALQTVEDSRNLTQPMKARAFGHRLAGYGTACRLLLRRLSIAEHFESARLGALIEFVKSGWFAPISDDDLFELYVLFLLMDILENELGFGKPTEYGLIRSGRRHVARYQNASGELRVFFDQSPASLFDFRSEYKRIIRAWRGISGSERRPDISIEFADATGKRVRFLVEAKRSDDRGYRSDSVYKVMGYLYDFRESWTSEAKPHVLLIFPDGIVPSGQPIPKEISVLAARDRTSVAEALRAIISKPASMLAMTT